MAFIFTILGVYTAYSFWGSHIILTIITVVVTFYQASSLNEMHKELSGRQAEDKMQTTINMFSSVVILVLFIFSFFA